MWKKYDRKMAATQKKLRKTKLDTNSRELIHIFMTVFFSIFFFTLLIRNENKWNKEERHQHENPHKINKTISNFGFLWPTNENGSKEIILFDEKKFKKVEENAFLFKRKTLRTLHQRNFRSKNNLRSDAKSM